MPSAILQSAPDLEAQERLLAVDSNSNQDQKGGKKIKFEIRDVVKVSGAGVPILSMINLDIPKGKIIGIIGLSGSGKLMLRALNRLWEAPSGTVFLDGEDIRQIRRKVGMLFQLPVILLLHVMGGKLFESSSLELFIN